MRSASRAARRIPTPFAVIASVALVSSAGAQTLTPPDTTQSCRWSKECSTAGARLEMVELRRDGTGKSTKVFVTPKVSGFPAGVPLTFWMRRVAESPQWVVAGYALDSTGATVCADRATYAALAATAGTGWCPVPLKDLSMTIGGMMEGEPIAFAMSTADGLRSAYAVVVPRPVASSVPSCGTLDAELLDATARTVSIQGRGFPPSTRLVTESIRDRDKVSGAVTTDSTGRFVAIVTSNGRGGEATYAARTGSCEVLLPYRWGRAAQ